MTRTLQDTLTTFILAGGLIFGITYFFAAAALQNLNPNIPNREANSDAAFFAKINEIQSLVVQQSDSIQESIKNVNPLAQIGGVIISGLGGVFALALTLPSFFTAFLTSFGTETQIAVPSWAVAMIMALVTIFFVFIGIKMINRGEV